ncbi:MAG TPA: D-glycerate dehydrogenase [Planctomycetota bacterium]|nr:D-glycerate dehydrogenase [Planctomycetota bacterium]
MSVTVTYRFRDPINLPRFQFLKGTLFQAAKRSEALITLLTDRVDRSVLEAGKNLRVVANVAVGVDNIDIETATRLGILVTNTPGVLTESTADLAWALILAVARRVVEGDALVRAGRFKGWGFDLLRGLELRGKTLGIVGAGRIGGAVARRARGFGMKVLVHSRTRGVPLQTLLKSSDVVSLHTPLTPASRHLIGAAELRLMKPTAILVNTARGPIVDEKALAEALRKRRIAGAGLDVYEREPKVHPGLMRLKNVVLLPHLGSATDDTRRAMLDTAVKNVKAALAGKRPPNLVNSEAWNRRR